VSAGLLLLQLAACSSHPPYDSQQSLAASSSVDSLDSQVGLNPYLLNRQSVPKRAQLGFDQALEEMRSQQWSRARSTLQLLTEDYPQLSGPWLNLGIVYLRLERLDEAAAAFRQAIAINGNNLEAYNQLASLRRSAGDFAAAESLYLEALAIWPQHAASHLNLGVLYDLYLGQFDKAAHHYEAYQSLQQEPDRRVAGWLLDMQRRPLIVAQSKVEQ
jgi:tetratricopeptide (TPR) repeat protein